MNKLYICHTPYHLYVSLIKAQQDRGSKSSLILCDQLKNYKSLKYLIDKEKIFEQIILVPDKKLSEEVNSVKSKFRILEFIFKKYRVEKVFAGNLKLKHIDIKTYQVNVFNDSSNLFLYLYKNINEVIVIEDGLRVYDKKRFIILRWVMFKIFKQPYLLRDGRYSKAKCVEVKYPNRITDLRKNKVLQLDIDSNFSNLNQIEKERIYRIFGFNPSFDSKIKKAALVLTQPLSEDKIVDESQKIEIYSTIINILYSKNLIIFVKKHPRDYTRYSFENYVNYLKADIPIELLNSSNFRVELAVGVYTSGIMNLKIGKEQINLINNFSEIGLLVEDVSYYVERKLFK